MEFILFTPPGAQGVWEVARSFNRRFQEERKMNWFVGKQKILN